jgi:prepilin-type N-terminal cleavage/methylation domain-containing protein
MVARRRTRPRRAFTLLELVIAICIIALLVTLALERLLALRAEAERVVLEETLGALRAGVAMELVSLLAKGADHELLHLHECNPMDSLMAVPANYLGELEAVDPSTIPPGNWYFDRTDRLLVYRVRYAEDFETELAGAPRARFRTELSYRDRDGNGRFDPGVDELRGVRVSAAEPYRWRGESSAAFAPERAR